MEAKVRICGVPASKRGSDSWLGRVRYCNPGLDDVWMEEPRVAGCRSVGAQGEECLEQLALSRVSDKDLDRKTSEVSSQSLTSYLPLSLTGLAGR